MDAVRVHCNFHRQGIVGFCNRSIPGMDRPQCNQFIATGRLQEIPDIAFTVYRDTCDGTDVVALDYLCSDASAHAVPYTTAELSTAGGTEGFEFHCIGQSLEAETGTTCTNVMLYKHI